MRGHYAENWTNVYLTEDIPVASSSQYTVLTYPVQHYSNAPDSYVLGDIMIQFPVGGQVDFQVEAMIGYFHKYAIPLSPWVFEGQTSGWSNTQSITIPETSIYASSTPSPTSMVPEFPEIIIVLIILMAVSTTAILLTVTHSKRKCRTISINNYVISE